jgi:DinB superfamily
LLNGEDFPGFNPDSEGTKMKPNMSPIRLAEEFARLREENLDLLAGVTPADLERTASHQELGMVTMHALLNEWVAHDLNHTVQAERALMQPFIRDCGPRVVYFSDHVARPK